MRLATVLLTIVLSLGLSGCWFRKKTTAIPPPPAPQPAQAPPVKPPEQRQPEQKPLPMPPQPEIKEPAQITLPAPQKTQPSRPPAKKKKTPPAAPQPPPPAEQPQAQPSPPPQLGAILSDAQRRQYEAEYAQSLSRARSALQQASGKSLNPTQRETVERIRTFVQQAEESKGKDLATALQLVRRADVLGQDLLKDLQ
jgi:predicted component of type VI protein secretion system